MSLSNLPCCAVKYLDGVSRGSPRDVLVRMYTQEQYSEKLRPAFVIFTARDEKMPAYEYGRNLKKYILDNRLGEIVESHAKRNIRPEYKKDVTHDVRVYIWEINHGMYDKWYTENKPKEPVNVINPINYY